MQISIKVVVGILLVVVCACTMIVAHVPAIIRLQQDALGLAIDESEASVGHVQDVVRRRFLRMQLSCTNLYRAAKQGNILELNRLLIWIGVDASEQELGGGIFVTDGTGVYLDAHVSLGPSLPGYVYVANLTVPNQYAAIGVFDVYTHSALVPFFTVPTTLQWTDFTGSADIMNPNRSSPLQWSRLLPFNAAMGLLSDAPSDSAIFFGGPVELPVGAPASSQQHVFLMLRGSWLSEYFASVNVSPHGVAVLIDAVSGNFVAGNINDEPGRPINATSNSSMADGSIELVPARELQDTRIAPILSAQTTWTPYGSGLDALMECNTSCVYLYWAHSHKLYLADGNDYYGTSNVFSVLFYRFTVVRVVQVHSAEGGQMSLRLIVTLPSEDVIGSFVSALQFSLVVPLCIMFVVCLCLVAVISFAFRGLTEVEVEMQQLAATFAPPQRPSGTTKASDTAGHNSPSPSLSSPPMSPVTTAGGAQQRSSTMPLHSRFTEFHRIFGAVRLLTWQLYTLRAFSTVPISSASYPQLTPMGANESLRTESQTPTQSRGWSWGAEESVPYVLTDGVLWSVPVTTIAAQLRSDFVGGPKDDPVVVHGRFNQVHALFQLHIKAFPGATMDNYCGDSLLVHFNAAARSPNHALSAVLLIQQCLAGLESIAPEGRPGVPPVFFGVASMLSLCGYMGPQGMKTFTVVSSGEPQAVMMNRIAEKKGLPAIMTWRSVDLARQQLQSIRSQLHPSSRSQLSGLRKAISPNGSTTGVAGGFPSTTTGATSPIWIAMEFLPISQVILPGEAQRQVSVAYAPTF